MSNNITEEKLSPNQLKNKIKKINEQLYIGKNINKNKNLTKNQINKLFEERNKLIIQFLGNNIKLTNLSTENKAKLKAAKIENTETMKETIKRVRVINSLLSRNNPSKKTPNNTQSSNNTSFRKSFSYKKEYVDKLITEITDISNIKAITEKIESGKLNPKKEITHIESRIQRLLDFLRKKIKDKYPDFNFEKINNNEIDINNIEKIEIDKSTLSKIMSYLNFYGNNVKKTVEYYNNNKSLHNIDNFANVLQSIESYNNFTELFNKLFGWTKKNKVEPVKNIEMMEQEGGYIGFFKRLYYGDPQTNIELLISFCTYYQVFMVCLSILLILGLVVASKGTMLILVIGLLVMVILRKKGLSLSLEQIKKSTQEKYELKELKKKTEDEIEEFIRNLIPKKIICLSPIKLCTFTILRQMTINNNINTIKDIIKCISTYLEKYKIIMMFEKSHEIKFENNKSTISYKGEINMINNHKPTHNYKDPLRKITEDIKYLNELFHNISTVNNKYREDGLWYIIHNYLGVFNKIDENYSQQRNNPNQ